MVTSGRQDRLVLQARAGDRESLEQLLSNIQPRLLGYITNVVGATAADDVLQETFIQVCRNLKWLRDPEVFTAWTFRIASRACFKKLRRDRRFATAVDDNFPASEDSQVSQPDLQLFCDLPELLDKISAASRAVLTLHYLQELPIAEVAAILEIGVGTAKSRLAYGLECLRRLVKSKEKI